ncbi:hypothetical protein VTK73DRAFT_3780 [Phialemonium thermophilum]|uniref:Uncharacterized protein n=1 Tax=Phialemonium thermophilum TaxID=223376 RepID=A0ABR3VES5_9PEZI
MISKPLLPEEKRTDQVQVPEVDTDTVRRIGGYCQVLRSSLSLFCLSMTLFLHGVLMARLNSGCWKLAGLSHSWMARKRGMRPSFSLRRLPAAPAASTSS